MWQAKNICFFLWFLCMVLLPIRGMAQIKVGILTQSGAGACLQRWTGLGAYLERELHEEVHILPLGFDVVEQVVADGVIDYLLANPFFFVSAREKYKARAIATVMTAWNDMALLQFAGVFFVRRESPVHQMADIRDRDVMVPDFSSFGDCVMAFRLLLDSDFDSRDISAAFVEGITPENVVLTVENGLVDVGMVRSGILERMAENGTIRMEDFRILHRIEDDFPLVHSTRLYPEWPMIALAHVNRKDSTAMYRALTAMNASLPSARQAGIAGWHDAIPYTVVPEFTQMIEQSSH